MGHHNRNNRSINCNIGRTNKKGHCLWAGGNMGAFRHSGKTKHKPKHLNYHRIMRHHPSHNFDSHSDSFKNETLKNNTRALKTIGLS